MKIFIVLLLLFRFLTFKIGCDFFFSHSKPILIFVLTLQLTFEVLSMKDGAKWHKLRAPQSPGPPVRRQSRRGKATRDGKIEG